MRGKPRLFVRILEKFGAGFRNQFSYEAYQAFFQEAGYSEVVYQFVKGKMACAIAVITSTCCPIRREQIAVLVSMGLIQGANNRLNPTKPAFRAEAVVLLYRVYTR